MGARRELNKHHVIGGLGLAGLLGLATGSTAVFLIAGATFLGLSICAGEIRFRKGDRRRRR